ncbi:hypothetical protein HMPREF0868_1612 [Mageeibacillus indolicus UPII9-5]|uniref:Uncharacterized protein n=1 Tax=Mageeibacillus indolicus (strain UPII9-5) TaxID=699246 RepID=D3QZG9_MAGIU|nr:hypothetical protein HMPREF0868_1612 [Mageeibacillus indolicus UPII9-5]
MGVIRTHGQIGTIFPDARQMNLYGLAKLLMIWLLKHRAD